MVMRWWWWWQWWWWWFLSFELSKSWSVSPKIGAKGYDHLDRQRCLTKVQNDLKSSNKVWGTASSLTNATWSGMAMRIHTMVKTYFLSFLFQKSGSASYVKREAPDIFCIQETKCQEGDVPKVETWSFPFFCFPIIIFLASSKVTINAPDDPYELILFFLRKQNFLDITHTGHKQRPKAIVVLGKFAGVADLRLL